MENSSENKEILNRLHTALDSLGLKRHGRGVEIAAKTGYSPGQVSGLLSGKVRLNDRFIKTICQTYSISEAFIRSGGEHGSQAKAGEIHEQQECYGGYISAVAEMMRGMDEETQKDIFLSVQKEKLLRELLTERQKEKGRVG